MGILNVTPDSFSDGGRLKGVEAAVEAALRMVDEGADLIDIGGESTRPGAQAVDAVTEQGRVLPVIAGLRRRSDVPISIDTMKSSVAEAALAAGADLVNDVSAARDPQMLPLLARAGAAVVLMHMRGEPRTMQRDTRYDDVTGDVDAFLRETARLASEAGVADDKIVVDPGIGFGKSTEGNLALLRYLPTLADGPYPVLVGASRKSFLGKLLDLPVDDRLEPSLAVAAYAAMSGVQIVRAHDVRETVRVVRTIDALRGAEAASQRL